MKSENEFLDRWRAHVAGLIALGSGQVRKVLTGPIESPAQFGQVMSDLADTSTDLLRDLYRYLNPPEPLPAKVVPVNGQAPLRKMT